MDVKQRIAELTATLNEYNYQYYVLANSQISDFDFDQKLAELSRLEEAHPEFLDPNSPTQKVGGDITSKFETVPHRWPMMSLGNTYNEQELKEFARACEKQLATRFHTSASSNLMVYRSPLPTKMGKCCAR